MTQWKTSQVSCPACCEIGNFKMCTSIDLEESPSLKEDIFSRELFHFSCPNCGEDIMVAYNCTLTDTENKLILALITDNDEEFESSRLMVDGYRLRIVHSINEFAEKAALSEDTIDDKVIELYKIMLEDQFEEERSGAEILGIYYGGRNFDDDTILFYIITGNAENCRATLSMDTYRAIEAQFAKNSEKYNNDCEINKDWAINVLQNGL